MEFDAEAKIFHGEVINTRDVITFQGRAVDELEQAFRDSVDEYISWCEAEAVPPEKPYSGRFNLRLSPELHRELAVTAKKRNVSINRFVEQAIEDELRLTRN
ncbi:MAG: type II toxin-antitoxin system HicB family antitoxin [Spirochaetaceae bacterium]